MKIDKGAYFNGNSGSILIGVFLFLLFPLLTLYIFLLPLLLLIIPVFTARNIIEIDFNNNKIFQYTSIFGEKNKKKGDSFGSIISIYLNEGRFTKTLNSRARSTKIKFTKYSAYFKTSEGKKYLIFSSEDKKIVMSKAELLSKQVNLPLKDNTK